MDMHPNNDRRAVRARIRAAREEAEELLEQRRREIRQDLEQRMREMAPDQPSAA